MLLRSSPPPFFSSLLIQIMLTPLRSTGRFSVNPISCGILSSHSTLPQLFKSLFPPGFLAWADKCCCFCLFPRSMPDVEVPVHILSSGSIYILPVLRSPKLTCLFSLSYSSLKVNVELSRVTEPGKEKMVSNLSPAATLCLCPATFISLLIFLLPSYAGGILWNSLNIR